MDVFSVHINAISNEITKVDYLGIKNQVIL
jgi:hypothetical protein